MNPIAAEASWRAVPWLSTPALSETGSTAVRMAESDASKSRDWSEVAADDGAFRTAAAATRFDGEQEAQALHSIMDGDSRTPCRTACIALGKESTLTSMRAIWEPWRAQSHSELAGWSCAPARRTCPSTSSACMQYTCNLVADPASASPARAEAVNQVVSDLDAEHLRPTGIEQRLIAGVQPACMGLFTLLQNLRPPPDA